MSLLLDILFQAEKNHQTSSHLLTQYVLAYELEFYNLHKAPQMQVMAFATHLAFLSHIQVWMNRST